MLSLFFQIFMKYDIFIISFLNYKNKLKCTWSELLNFLLIISYTYSKAFFSVLFFCYRFFAIVILGWDDFLFITFLKIFKINKFNLSNC